MPLTRKRVIAAAIELIEADGVEAVSMPRLAAELGCSLVCLYSHVPSKNALLDGVAAEIMSGVAVPPASDPSWPERVRAQVRAFRQAARAHPRCTLVALSRPAATASMVRPAENALATLRQAGFGGLEAVRIMRAFVAYVSGSLLREVGVAPGLAEGGGGPDTRLRLRAAEFPQVTDLADELRSRDLDADFEFGLDLLVTALAALCPGYAEH